MIRVLSVTSECAPLVKTGGLADVAGALPGALADQGVEVRTLIPGYRQVMADLEDVEPVLDFKRRLGAPARLLKARAEGLALLVLDAPKFFDRGAGIYGDETGKDWPDNPERFAALSLAAAEIAASGLGDWSPDLVHCHDWQAGLAPYYIAKARKPVPTVLTIHNIAFQGLAPKTKLKALKIAQRDFTPQGVEYWDKVSALKAGLVYADRLTTVSPTYAEELMTPEFGMGLDGVLRARRGSLSGILNGIDETVWSPENDQLIRRYKTPRGKVAAKRKLRAEFDLPDTNGPLCVVVSRLTQQKGLDLLAEALPTLTGRGGQLILLGSGDAGIEADFQALEGPNVAIRIGYDEALSHRMIAGGDAILVPSRFEPCGLTQLYGLRYGTLPVVALTGGLADTVIPATPATMAREVATGVQFFPITTESLSNALGRLCDLFSQPNTWLKMQRNAMSHPVGWEMSAASYAELYREALTNR